MSRLVYSTDFGRACPRCGKPVNKCMCIKSTPAAGDGVVRVRRETKGRGGKTVTTVTGLPLDDEGLKQAATRLKRHCGTGGSVKDGIVIIQGDHCDELVDLLKQEGFSAKRSGG